MAGLIQPRLGVTSAQIRRKKPTFPKDFYSKSLDLLLEGLALLDEEGTICFANLAMERMLCACDGSQGGDEGVSLFALDQAEEDRKPEAPSNCLIGESVYSFIPVEFKENFVSLIELLGFGPDSLGPFETALVRQNGRQLQVQLNLGKFNDHGKRFISMMVQDITEWNEAKTTLELAKFQIEQSYSETIKGWAMALELRHLESHEHSKRIVPATLFLAERIGFTVEEMTQIRHGAYLHDIGKLSIPDDILKKPGPLTPEEWVIMRMHPEYARQLLEPIEYLKPAITIPYYHHEKWDGSGYPVGLKGEAIPLPARIFAVVDVAEALLDKRGYRGYAWSDEKVYAYVQENVGKHFDPQISRMFLAAFDQILHFLKKPDTI
jgi:HD-GYP domain-containing protein (c-di-GMP phosphodiesterase class II)